jgi:hypothetical protein
MVLNVIQKLCCHHHRRVVVIIKKFTVRRRHNYKTIYYNNPHKQHLSLSPDQNTLVLTIKTRVPGANLRKDLQ